MVNPLSILFSIFLVIIIFHIYCHYTVLCADLLIKCSIMQNKAVMFFDSFEGSFFRRWYQCHLLMKTECYVSSYCDSWYSSSWVFSRELYLGMVYCLQYGSLSGPFAPVVDGIILPDTPTNLRKDKKQMKVKILAGLTKDEGAYYACMSSCLYGQYVICVGIQ